MSSASIGPQVILVTGPSGAGKTLFSLALVEALGVARCVRVGMDDYYADNRGMTFEERSSINFDHPDAIDWALLMEHVRTLLDGEAIQKPCYDFVTHTRLSHTEVVQPLPYIVFDGIHAMADDALVRLAELTIYVDAARATCLARRLRRDAVERGRTEASVREQFDGTVWPMAERYILPKRDQAAVVVSGEASFDEAIQMVLDRIG